MMNISTLIQELLSEKELQSEIIVQVNGEVGTNNKVELKKMLEHVIYDGMIYDSMFRIDKMPVNVNIKIIDGIKVVPDLGCSYYIIGNS